ncbi:hypothetical protein SAMN03080602_02940 [Arenibacter troitsensis]|uniref:Uncharacterized protein n=1 Tax=Arenibacter troitsensis TaxID=188872 RepID=A0A1X7KI81_9FLAO|nr:hypothetical protein SAMN03080602_02940 [Arenibacter troitsensis]
MLYVWTCYSLNSLVIGNLINILIVYHTRKEVWYEKRFNIAYKIKKRILLCTAMTGYTLFE